MGSTTSAMVRDAARLRSVMGRGERENDGGAIFDDDRDRLIPEPEGMGAHHGGDVDRDIAMPPLGAGARAVEAPVSHHDDAAPHATPTTLRAPAAQPKRQAPIASSEGVTGGATTLKPVDALKELEERARIVAAAKKMAPRQEPAPEPPRAAAQSAPHAYAAPEGGGRGAMAMEPDDDLYHRPRRPRRPRGRSLMGAVTVFAGTAIGIGLYAGGGDLLSRFFSNKNEGVMIDNPAAVTERPVTIVPPPAASAMPSVEGAETSTAPSGTALANDPALAGATAAPTHTSAVPSAADHAVAEPRTEAKPVVDKPENPVAVKPKPAESKAPAEKSSTMVNNLGTTSSAKPATKPLADAKAAKPTKPADNAAKSKATSKPAQAANATYVVQVRATPDEAEANRIARKLRAKGVKDVKVDLSQKNGTAVYRVRYGAFASTADAKSSAGRAGVGDAWVVKK